MEKQKIKPISGEESKEFKAERWEGWRRGAGDSVSNYEVQGHWNPSPGVTVRMYLHVPTGHVLYEDHPLAHSRRLPILPAEFAGKIT